jgi:Tol biopolymer transport system component
MQHDMRETARALIASVLLLAAAASAAGAENATERPMADAPCIAFVSTRGAAAKAAPGSTGSTEPAQDLFITNYQGKALVNVTNDPESRPHSLQWSPDGATLAWLSSKGIEALSGGVKRTLVKRDEFIAQILAWSPRSDMIAFYGVKMGKNAVPMPGGVFLVDLAGGEPTKFMDLRDAPIMRWAANIDSLLLGAPNGAVLLAPVQGRRYAIQSTLVFRPETPDIAIDLAVSPDGSLGALSLAEKECPEVRTIRIFATNGGSAKRLIESTDVGQVFPAWRPTDNKVLAFIGQKDEHRALYLCQIDSGTLSRVALPKPYTDVSAFGWSSDGARVAVQCEREDAAPGVANILILDAVTMKLTPLTDSAAERDSEPAWRPEGARETREESAPTIETTAAASPTQIESTSASVESTEPSPQAGK